MNLIRVVLADDHGLIRAGLRSVIGALEDIVIVGEAQSGPEALGLVETLRPQVLISDITMVGMTGLEVIARVVRDFPETRTIVLSMHTEKEYVARALRAGAAGYLAKDQGTDEIEFAIRSVARGETYLSPTISGVVVGNDLRLSEEHAQTTDPLTPRQREILVLIAEGLSTKAIARHRNVSVKTVEAHRTQLMERLGIHEIAGLVRYAIRIGLVKPEE